MNLRVSGAVHGTTHRFVTSNDRAPGIGPVTKEVHRMCILKRLCFETTCLKNLENADVQTI